MEEGYERLKALTGRGDVEAARRLCQEALRKSFWDDVQLGLDVLKKADWDVRPYRVYREGGATRMDITVPLGPLGRSMGRVYPPDVMKSAVQAYQVPIQDRRAMGTLGGPVRDAVIPIKEVSHRVVAMEVVDDAVLVTLEVLDTERGALLKAFLKASGDSPVTVHLNGTGGVKSGVVTEFKLMSVSIHLDEGRRSLASTFKKR